MRETWRRILVLCVACVIIGMNGLCMAEDGKWVHFYTDPENPNRSIFYVDDNSIKAREYDGKKYLELSVRRKNKDVEQIWFVFRPIEVTNAKWHMLMDLENRSFVSLEWESKESHGAKKGKEPIFSIKSGGWRWNHAHEQLASWVEKNHPDVINEICSYNHSLPPSQTALAPVATEQYGTSVPQPEGTAQPATPVPDAGKYEPGTGGDVKTEWLEGGGLVVTETRYGATEINNPTVGESYPYVISVATGTDGREQFFKEVYAPISENGRGVISEIPMKGEYMVVDVFDTMKACRVTDVFDYDPETGIFEWYGDQFDYLRFRIIDRNTIEVLPARFKITHSYPHSLSDWEYYKCISEADHYNHVENPIPISIAGTYHYVKYAKWMDEYVGYGMKETGAAAWFVTENIGRVAKYAHGPWVNDLSIMVDICLAFLSVNGDVGQISEDIYEVRVWDLTKWPEFRDEFRVNTVNVLE